MGVHMADVVDLGERIGADLEIIPDIILPEQFLAGARRDSDASGEKALMLAVLEDDIRCFQGHLTNTRSNPRLLEEQAEEWIRADDWDWPFSFNNVCSELGIDPEAMRKALLVWKARQREERMKAICTGEPKGPARVYRLHLRTRLRYRRP